MALAHSVRADGPAVERTLAPERVAGIRDRWRLLTGLSRLTTLERTSRCSRRPVAPKGQKVEGPRVMLDGSGRASYAGVETCASIWACPCCSPRIRQQRAVEIGTAANTWTGQDGHLEFLTFTMAHRAEDPLGTSLADVLAAFRTMQQRTAWRRLKGHLGVVGFIRATEITLGRWNGWHPHLHVVLFTSTPLTDDQRADLHYTLWSAWQGALASRGRSASYAHGLDWRPASGGAGLAWYLAKVQDGGSLGLEVARHDVKKGRKASRTPFELLADALRDPCPEASPDARSWRHYERATRGRRAIEWSRGLRAHLEVAGTDDDDQVLTDDDTLALVTSLNREDWRLILRNRARGDVLVAAENHGGPGVAMLLSRIRRREQKARLRMLKRAGCDSNGVILRT